MFAHVSTPRPPRLDTCPRMARIDRCHDSLCWYAGRVGQTVRIEFIDSCGYWAREGGMYNAINRIQPSDATLLPLEN